MKETYVLLMLLVSAGVAFGVQPEILTSTTPSLVTDNQILHECTSNEDCPSGFSCVDHHCTDLCQELCGVNSECVSADFGPSCSCLPGYSGNPFTECTQEVAFHECTSNSECSEDRACLNYKCIDPCLGACGLNANCKVANHKPVCACFQGFYLNSTFGCQPMATTQCQKNNHCSKDKACIDNKCLDPCIDMCGNNTQCKVRNHNPSCSCKLGYIGDPFDHCDPLCLPLKEDTHRTGIKKYIQVLEKKTFHEASHYCQKRDMQLATVENEEENDKLQSLMTDDEGSHWTSGHLLRMPWVFYWMNTGDLVTYSNWHASNPSGDGENCIVVNQIGWFNIDCSSERAFFCQYYE